MAKVSYLGKNNDINKIYLKDTYAKAIKIIKEKITVTSGNVSTINPFKLSYVPISNSIIIDFDGIVLTEGSDYTVSDDLITFLGICVPEVGEIINIQYNYSD